MELAITKNHDDDNESFDDDDDDNNNNDDDNDIIISSSRRLRPILFTHESLCFSPPPPPKQQQQQRNATVSAVDGAAKPPPPLPSSKAAAAATTTTTFHHHHGGNISIGVGGGGKDDGDKKKLPSGIFKKTPSMYNSNNDENEKGSTTTTTTTVAHHYQQQQQQSQKNNTFPTLLAQPPTTAASSKVEEEGNDGVVDDDDDVSLLLLLPEEVLIDIMHYVGKGNYRFVGCVCKSFHMTYQDALIQTLLNSGDDDDDDDDNDEVVVCRTYYCNAAKSLSTIQLCLDETKDPRLIAKEVYKIGYNDGLVCILNQPIVKFPDYYYSAAAAAAAAAAGNKNNNNNKLLWDDPAIFQQAAAIDNNSKKTIKYLFRIAIEKKHWTFIDYVLENSDRCDVKTFLSIYIVRNDDLELLEFVITTRGKKQNPFCFYTFREKLLYHSATYGKLQIIKYVTKEKKNFRHRHYKEICYLSSYYGHLDVLIWSVTNGCPWNRKQCKDIATQKQHMDIVHWIDEYTAEKKIKSLRNQRNTIIVALFAVVLYSLLLKKK